MLMLMVNDDMIAEYIYAQGPPSFQTVRYTDWIKPYLDQQKEETEKNATYSYMKNKFDCILEALKLYDQLEANFLTRKREEEKQAADLLGTTDAYANLDRNEDWFAYNHTDVLPHYPP
mmetsp:Transcript_23121/g.22555  ORF Transcript_23121/g.22555 Transcript_23121/m.22555 type:complete len:118 (+) Transcript_23121:2615-2968(+)